MISFLAFIITVGIAILGLFLTISFCEYLKKYLSKEYELITYERPFGISRENFLLHPVKPHRFLAFIFSSKECYDENVPAYKNKIKLAMISLVLLIGVSFFTH